MRTLHRIYPAIMLVLMLPLLTSNAQDGLLDKALDKASEAATDTADAAVEQGKNLLDKLTGDGDKEDQEASADKIEATEANANFEVPDESPDAPAEKQDDTNGFSVESDDDGNASNSDNASDSELKSDSESDIETQVPGIEIVESDSSVETLPMASSNSVVNDSEYNAIPMQSYSEGTIPSYSESVPFTSSSFDSGFSSTFASGLPVASQDCGCGTSYSSAPVEMAVSYPSVSYSEPAVSYTESAPAISYSQPVYSTPITYAAPVAVSYSTPVSYSTCCHRQPGPVRKAKARVHCRASQLRSTINCLLCQ